MVWLLQHVLTPAVSRLHAVLSGCRSVPRCCPLILFSSSVCFLVSQSAACLLCQTLLSRETLLENLNLAASCWNRQGTANVITASVLLSLNVSFVAAVSVSYAALSQQNYSFVLHVDCVYTSVRELLPQDRKSTRLNSSHVRTSRMPSSA